MNQFPRYSPNDIKYATYKFKQKSYLGGQFRISFSRDFFHKCGLSPLDILSIDFDGIHFLIRKSLSGGCKLIAKNSLYLIKGGRRDHWPICETASLCDLVKVGEGVICFTPPYCSYYLESITMNKLKFDNVYSGLNATCKKVYDCVPSNDRWKKTLIHSEIKRRGFNYDASHVDGCLHALLKSGLITDQASGFRRVDIIDTENDKLIVNDTYFEKLADDLDKAVSTKKTNANPFDKISDIADEVKTLIAGMNKLLESVEETAIYIQDEISKIEEKNKSLKQLQNILKNLGD
jgi:hypothetical protein